MALPLTYNWRNLFVRKLSTALTFTVVVIVVLVLSVLLSFVAGIRMSLAATGSERNLIVLKPGATAESTSIIDPDEAARLVQTPGIARDGNGRMMISHELCVQTSIARQSGNGMPANVAVRGVTDMALAVHDEVRIVEGRLWQPGMLEVIVGKAARERYVNLELGDEIALGRLSGRMCRVVGVFEAGGGALESEIWVPLTLLADSYHRRYMSSAAIRLESPRLAEAAIAYINGPAVRLEASRELDYYLDLSEKTREIVVLTTILVSIMAIGAVFAVANTMYASVDGRRREMAMLRTIGFSRSAILASVVVESLLICVLACVSGLALSLLADGSRQDFLSNTTWTVLAYELRVTPNTIATALVLSVVVGVTGSLAPAVRAARTNAIEALRKA